MELSKIPIREIPIANEWFNFFLILFGLLKMNSVQRKLHTLWEVSTIAEFIIKENLLQVSKNANGFL
jgi:hypothetical protein